MRCWFKETDPIREDLVFEPGFEGDPPGDVPDDLVGRYLAAVEEWDEVQEALYPYWKAAHYPDGFPIEQEVRERQERVARERAVLEQGMA